MVRRQNEGSFGCEAVARALGQPNVPECAVGFHFLCLYAAKISLSFCRLFLSFYNERQLVYIRNSIASYFQYWRCWRYKVASYFHKQM